MDDFFSLKGRYARKKYWVGALGLFMLLVFMLLALGPLMTSKGSAGSGPLVTIALMSLPFVGLYAKLIIHRLHDLAWSGWWFLPLGPLLIPLPIWMWLEGHTQEAINNKTDFALEFGAYGIFLGGFVLFGCVRGTEGPNEYGPDPLNQA